MSCAFEDYLLIQGNAHNIFIGEETKQPTTRVLHNISLRSNEYIKKYICAYEILEV